MEVFNNTTKVVRDDLAKTIKNGSRVSVAAACFSIYAYQELKKQLEACEELRFIFEPSLESVGKESSSRQGNRQPAAAKHDH